MAERAATENFAYNVKWAKPGPYVTPLTTGEEYQYRDWVRHVTTMVKTDLNPDDPGYDMRGYWKHEVQTGQWDPSHFTTGAHFPDTYKTPYHPTFSRESLYATPDAPFWKNNKLVDPTTGKATPGDRFEKQREKENR